MSLKILINNEEVVCNSNIQINEEMLSTSSTILKNCYPKSWENDKDYVSRYYYPKDYSKCKIYNLPRENTTQEQTGTNSSFETYTGKSTLEDIKFYGDTLQNGTPTPDTPVEIQSVTGLQNVEVCGKNLFDKTTIKSGYLIQVNGNEVANTSYGASDYIPVKANTQYTRVNCNNYYGAFYDSNKNFVGAIQNANTITPSVDGYVRISFLLTNIDSVQLEKGSTATTYEPYKGNTYEVNLGKNLFNSFIATKPSWQSGNLVINEDGSFTVSENSGSNNYFQTGQKLRDFCPSLNVGDTVYLYLETTNSNKRIYIGQNWVNGKSKTITQTMLNSNFVIYGGYGQTDTIKIMITKGLDTNYSPYFTPIELNKIGTYQDYIYKNNGTWYKMPNVLKIESYNGETITTDYKSTTGGLDTGATIYYGNDNPVPIEITNTELINQLESINIQLYENETNFIISGSLPMPTYIKIYTNFEELIFCGFTKNTGNVSLNPRQFHGVDLQILDFKDLLSTGETLNYVIANKTITEAINQVVNSISDYGFVVGNIQLLNPNEVIGAYSTLNKTAYDVFQYIADITQSRWTTRMIDENTIAIDFYDPTLMPTGTPIESTQTFYENYKIIDMSFNYSTNDYRNKQIMTSDEVYANITQTETIIADGYATSFMCQNKIGIITSIKLNGVERSYATKSEEQLGVSADFVYQPGDTTFISNNSISAGGVILITYYPIVKGREIILNNTESNRIENQINRKGTISRYENRNDTTSSQELQKIGQSYIKYKGKAEINLKIQSELNTWNVGEIVLYNAPLSELSTTYMVKSKEINMYLNANKIFYTYNLTSNYNSENAINYFDNQRAKNQGNIGEGETITRNIDLENEALILFYDTEINEIQVSNPTSLDFALDGVLI